MIIASASYDNNATLDAEGLAHRVFCAGQISYSQRGGLQASLKGYQPKSLQIEKVGGKIWVTMLTQSGRTMVWAIGPRGKVTAPNMY